MWRAVVEHAPDVILRVDTEGLICFINQPAAQSIVGQLWLAFVPEASQELVRNALVHVLGGGAPLTYETEGVDPLTGQTALFACRIGAVRSGPTMAGAVIVARDITLQRQNEEILKRVSHQLLQGQKLAAIGELAAGVAHEINTPIQYVNDNTVFLERSFKKVFELIEALRPTLNATGDVAAVELDVARTRARAAKLDYLAREVPKALAQCQDGLRRVATIVTAMKDFSHPSGTEKTTVVLRDLIETTATISRNEWRYVADLTIEVADDMPLIPALRDELCQVLLNMIINAAHAIEDRYRGTDARGRIVIHAAVAGSWAEIRIQDDGAGIPEAIREKVFRPFFTTKGVGRGTGQGLAITQSVIVGKHGGDVSMESEVGVGTTFIIRLPLARSDAGPALTG
jgi:two-component system, NtrC family, sensor kinase